MKRIKVALHWQILIVIALAIPCGMIFSDYVHYIKWIGDLFLRALKMIIVPIVFTSIVSAVSGFNSPKDLGRLAWKTFAFYIVTTLIAALLGVFLVNVFSPGVGTDINLNTAGNEIKIEQVSFVDQILGIVPDNIVNDFAKGNLLGIIFFAIIFGVFLTKTESKYRGVISDLFSGLYDLFMKMTIFIVKFTPIGVFALVSNIIASQGGSPDKILSILGSLGFYTIVVWLGCLIQGGLILPGIVYSFTRYNPYKHIKQMSVPLLTAFSTCSSGAALPLSIEASQNKTGISSKVAGFVLPLGCTVNMNGTALYEGISAIFIAQVYGIELTLVQQFLIILTSVLAAIGSAGIPMAGLVMMSVVLSIVGLPLEGIGLILAVQQLCDMARSTINSYGDMCAAVVIAKSEGEKLNL